jgi:hypothetical protein
MSAPATRDYFAELYVAGLFGDAGWAVYFPKRDVGFDFVATKSVNGQTLLRPVQVKGLYPTLEKKDKATLGFKGELTAVHPEMVLAIPYFSMKTQHSPEAVAYMPHDQFKTPIVEAYAASQPHSKPGRRKRVLTLQSTLTRRGSCALKIHCGGAVSNLASNTDALRRAGAARLIAASRRSSLR